MISKFKCSSVLLRYTTLESLTPSVNMPLVERHIYIYMDKQKNMYQSRSRKICKPIYGTVWMNNIIYFGSLSTVNIFLEQLIQK
jgi:hypothetical protein